MPTDDLSAANLDQVRNILFGDQARDNKKRFAQLEARMSKEITSIRSDLVKRIEGLERNVSKDHEALSKRLHDEIVERSDSNKVLSKQLADAVKGIESKLAQLQETGAKSARDLRSHLDKQLEELVTRFDERYEELSAEVDAELEDLDEKKVAKEDLSSLFADAALRLVDKKKPARKG